MAVHDGSWRFMAPNFLQSDSVKRMTTRTLTVSVPGMTCGHCEAAVKQEVGQIPGVISVDVDLETKLVTVVGSTDRAAIAAAVDEAGFEVA
jgi:copper chaperone